MGLTGVSLALAAGLAASMPSAPQAPADRAVVDQAASVRPPRPTPQVGALVFGFVGRDSLAASKSFQAVLGTSNLWAYGAGVDITNLWNGAFARVAVSRASRVGSRAFVFEGTVFSLHIPLTVSMIPIEIAGGWRFAPLDQPGRFTPYAGGGFVMLRYRETSEFATGTDNVATFFHGATAFGGFDVGIGQHAMAGVEAQYRHVGNAAGAGGLSAALGEHDLGGFTVRIMFGIKR